MTDKTAAQATYTEKISRAIHAMRDKEYQLAQLLIADAMRADSAAPAAHNLLGVLAELGGETALAGKHYRAAYALEPSYKPAARNLDRITSIRYRMDNVAPDYGDGVETVEENNGYIIEYDDKNIGRVKKKGI